ncbi:aspartate aminotransferase family protein [Dactylosporangium sp. CA-139066]|uniref:aspartate aminotransferase family protein n=1 Tax=Dactylosporangium sp. CA-139066 TaxID=3239930 RepID=UPI003D8FE1D1
MSAEHLGEPATRTIAAWPGSQAAWRRARASLAGGVSTGLRASMPPHPLFFDRGAGSRLWDVDGNSYLDYVLGWGPIIVGHSHPAVVTAVGEQLHRGQTFGSGHALEYEVAERLCARVPGAQRVLWSNTGSEAVQVALRLARAHTGRHRFVKFEGHYHGWTDQVLVSYRNLAEDGRPALGSAGQHPGVLADVSVLPFNDSAAVAELLARPDSDIAAVLVEPVLCNTGVLPPAPGFLEDLRALCDRTGTVLVFDEVITGLRMASGGAAERYGVTPDLTVLAKALAGGFSLSAVTGRADIVQQVTSGVVHAGTYNGNPIALAAAAATLDLLGGPEVYPRLEAVTAQLAEGLRAAFARHGVTAAVHHVGPVLQVSPGVTEVRTVREVLAADWAFYNELVVQALRRGVFLLPGGRWYLSTEHSAADVTQTVAALDDALDALSRAGAVPVPATVV